MRVVVVGHAVTKTSKVVCLRTNSSVVDVFVTVTGVPEMVSVSVWGQSDVDVLV